MNEYAPDSMSGERRTVDIFGDIPEAFVFTNFTNNFLYGVCKSGTPHQLPVPRLLHHTTY